MLRVLVALIERSESPRSVSAPSAMATTIAIIEHRYL
jgi:hypothetical protein